MRSASGLDLLMSSSMRHDGLHLSLTVTFLAISGLAIVGVTILEIWIAVIHSSLDQRQKVLLGRSVIVRHGVVSWFFVHWSGCCCNSITRHGKDVVEGFADVTLWL